MSSSHAHKKFLMVEDVKLMCEKCTELDLTEDKIMLAFSHAKELHVKEMDDIDKYKRLGFTEFLEFIARLGVLLYQDQVELLL
jgi:hypothetical protein